MVQRFKSNLSKCRKFLRGDHKILQEKERPQQRFQKKAKQLYQVLTNESKDDKEESDDQNPRKIVASINALLCSGEIGNSSMGCWAEENGTGPLFSSL